VKKTLLLFLSITCFAANSHDFSKDQKWLNLYRYKKSGQSFESLVQNKNWFFSQNGRTSPEEEAKAAIRNFNLNPKSRCRFPARTRYMRELNLIKSLPIKCPELDYLKKKLNLEQVSLVFASYHVNNPSSAFGHTLFKLKGLDQVNDYLNWGVNFAAIQTTKNPLLYGIYGLTGGFRGKFSLLPYFMKLKEYQDHENRDLWEYSLRLTKKQLKYFLEHLWEMNSAEFDYYYLTQNCSYHLLSFLDAIGPEWNLTQQLSYFVIPSDTLKVLMKAKVDGQSLVLKKSYRPSPFKKLKTRLANVSKRQKERLQSSYHSLKTGEKIEETDLSKMNTQSLDILIDLFDFNNPTQLAKGSLKQKRKVQALRSKRQAKVASRSRPSTPAAPDLIHPSSLLSLGRGSDLFSRKFTSLELRASFDEYLDRQRTRDRWSQLVLGKIKVNYNERERDLRLNRFTILNVEANNQSLFSNLSTSWSLLMAAEDREITKGYDLGPLVSASYGINLQFKNSLLRFTIPLALQWAKRSQSTYHQRSLSMDTRFVGELLHRLNDRTSFILSSALWHHSLLKSKLRFVSKFQTRLHILSSWALDIGTTYRLNQWEYEAKLVKYF
jgi:hypothetical protein